MSLRLAIKVECLLTVVIVVFGNGLGARTTACWNADISGTVPAANEAVPGMSG